MQLVKTVALSLLLLGLASSSRAEILFQGVVTAGTLQQFALQDTVRGVSRWCKVGESFSDLTLRRYDAESETLFCRSTEGAETRLALNVSVVRALKSTPLDEQYGQVFVAPELLEELRGQGLAKRDVFSSALIALESALAKAKTEQDSIELKALIEGFKAGRVKLYDTGGRPLRYEDAPNLSREAVDRINQLQTMTIEEVDAMIEARKKAKQGGGQKPSRADP